MRRDEGQGQAVPIRKNGMVNTVAMRREVREDGYQFACSMCKERRHSGVRVWNAKFFEGRAYFIYCDDCIDLMAKTKAGE